MRKLLVGVVCAVAMAVPSVSPAQQQEGWSYAYTDGVAAATLRDSRGRVTATLTCRPPTGDIVVTDYTLARTARNANTAAVRIGAMSVNVPMTRWHGIIMAIGLRPLARPTARTALGCLITAACWP